MQRRVGQAHDPVVVGARAEQRVWCELGCSATWHPGPHAALAGGIVELGRGRELVVRAAGAHHRGAAQGQHGTREPRHELERPVDRRQILGQRRRLGEAAGAATGESHERQPVLLQRRGERQRPVGVVADHGVGDLDAGIAAAGDGSQQIVGLPGPARAQHLPGIGLAADLQLRALCVRVAHSLTAPCVRPSMMCRWKNSTSTINGTVTTTDAAAMSPQGT